MPKTKKTYLVKDVMTRAPVTIDHEASIAKALSLMQQKGIRHLPVLANDKAIGVISERDIKLVVGVKSVDIEEQPVKLIYSPIPYQVPPEAHVSDVARKMAKEKFGSALVTDDGNVVGIFTSIDALQLLHKLTV